MLGFNPRLFPVVVSLGLSLALAACGDSAVEPTSNADHAVVGTLPTPAGGATTIALASNSTIGYCGYNATTMPTAATSFTGGGGNAFDLTAAIAGFNPGWPAPPAGASWIGSQADANQYRVPVGTNCFRTTFNIPNGATDRLLNLTVRADNVAIVYLNGVEIGRHTPTFDNSVNWTTNLLISDGSNFVSGTNTLTIQLVNTRIGDPGNNCADGPPNGAEKLPSQGGTWSVAECRNPSALSFVGAAYYIPTQTQEQLIPLFVIGDAASHAIGDKVYFWGAQWLRNNPMTGEVSSGASSFKGYTSENDMKCGAEWFWFARTGASSGPPATIPTKIAVIVTSQVIKAGSKFKGDIKQIIIVNQDGSYGPNPGNDGKGIVQSVQCSI